MKSRVQLFCVLIWLASLAGVPAKEFLVYFGTYTNHLSRGIYVSRLDADTGKFSMPKLAAETPDPCFLAISPDEKFLYAATSVRILNGEKTGAVSAFAIEKNSGALTLLNQKSSGGGGPCYVSVDATGKILLTANYGGGSVKSFLLNDDGSIGRDGTLIQFHGHGANTNRQSSPHGHFFATDPSNHFALACDLGTDQVTIYQLDATSATLRSNSVASLPPGSGARHLAFSRDGKFAYIISEMACTITTFAWNSETGNLQERSAISALPPDVAVQNNFTAAEIVVHPTGKYIYATVRGHDSVSVFAADEKTGALTFVQNISAAGKIPRGLGVDPTGHWLVVANQKTDNVTVFAIDAATGKLTPTDQKISIGAPVDVKFLKID
jgi:6-phosphogluconolactonase